MKVFNRYSGEDFAEVNETDAREVEVILERGVAASRELRHLPKFTIHDVLLEVAGSLEENKAELSRLITLETGKPIRMSRIDVENSSQAFTRAAEDSTRQFGETYMSRLPSSDAIVTGFFKRVPSGLVSSIIPFSGSLAFAAGKVACALAGGNAIVLKPSSTAALATARMLDLVGNTGMVGDSAQQVICKGDGDAAGLLLDSLAVSRLTFAGTEANALKVAAKTGLKKLSIELGGACPAIVWDDSDLDKAAERIASAAFEFQGQTPAHVQKILVKKEAYEYLRNRFIELVSKLKAGNPLEESTDIGPLKSAQAAEQLEAELRDAEKRGATVVAGGTRNGSLFYPTLVEEVPPDSNLWRRHILGPVSLIRPVDSFEEALELANSDSHGPLASLFTSDLNLALTAIDRLDYGTVLINESSLANGNFLPLRISRNGTNNNGWPYASLKDMTDTRLAVFRQ